jgi:FAD/FMN-containing dehydrogenase
MLPSRCADFCRELANHCPDALIQAHAGNGIVSAQVGQGLTLEKASNIVSRCREWLGTHGSIVVQRCPAEWKETISIWGPQRSEFALMRTIKEKLDPHGMFNPGRFVDGI